MFAAMICPNYFRGVFAFSCYSPVIRRNYTTVMIYPKWMFAGGQNPCPEREHKVGRTGKAYDTASFEFGRVGEVHASGIFRKGAKS